MKNYYIQRNIESLIEFLKQDTDAIIALLYNDGRVRSSVSELYSQFCLNQGCDLKEHNFMKGGSDVVLSNNTRIEQKDTYDVQQPRSDGSGTLRVAGFKRKWRNCDFFLINDLKNAKSFLFPHDDFYKKLSFQSSDELLWASDYNGGTNRNIQPQNTKIFLEYEITSVKELMGLAA